MLTRLKVSGFKNLLEVDVHFGPFTCIAGANGVGKSNLFDAIAFLSALADRPFIEAARQVRGGDDPASLFSDPIEGRMSLTAEMLIPKTGSDDFGQPAEASSTFIRYELVLALEKSKERFAAARIRLEKEELSYITKADAEKHLPFDHSKAWRDSVVVSSRKTSFIQTDEDGVRGRVIRLQSDRMRNDAKSKRGGGKATAFSADSLPRTVLSSAQNADESRTAVIVRQEMRSWTQLQLEPTALRSPDDFESIASIDPSGRHIPSTLARLAGKRASSDSEVFVRLANSLTSLVEDVRSVRVDRDEARRSLRFMMKDKSGLELPASSLSDGTLRLVALSVIELDSSATGLICLEEPENGIHPQRVNAMLGLLHRIACDPGAIVDVDNPLRQIVVSTHSPIVVRAIDVDDVVYALPKVYRVNGRRVRGVVFEGLMHSWRHRLAGRAIGDGEALAYLQGSPTTTSPVRPERSLAGHFRKQLQLDLPGAEE